MNKDLKKIFLALLFYEFACGIFYNFQQLWMAENNLSVQTISTVYSLCALITVSVIFLSSNIITRSELKKFTCLLLFVKGLLILSLFLLHNSGLNILIKFIIMIEFALDVEVATCIYPLISIIKKSDKLYAIKDLVNASVYYVAVLLAGLLLGRKLFTIEMNYNFYCLVGSISVFVAYIIMRRIDFSPYLKKTKKTNNNEILSEVTKNIRNDKISKNYLLYCLCGNISFFCVTSLMLTILTNNMGYEASAASNIILVLGIISVGLGSLILAKLTLKNNYINILIKFGSRAIFLLLAFIIGRDYSFLLAMIVMKLFADSYSHITDAPYVNRFKDEYQLAFCNLKEMVNYFSRAIGTLLCGFAIGKSIRLIFLFGTVFVILQIFFAFKALRLRLIEEGKKNDRK